MKMHQAWSARAHGSRPTEAEPMKLVVEPSLPRPGALGGDAEPTGYNIGEAEGVPLNRERVGRATYPESALHQ